MNTYKCAIHSFTKQFSLVLDSIELIFYNVFLCFFEESLYFVYRTQEADDHQRYDNLKHDTLTQNLILSEISLFKKSDFYDELRGVSKL